MHFLQQKQLKKRMTQSEDLKQLSRENKRVLCHNNKSLCDIWTKCRGFGINNRAKEQSKHCNFTYQHLQDVQTKQFSCLLIEMSSLF